jgi:hypothetical protein
MEREMIDYLIGRVKRHAEQCGESCHTIAIVTRGDKFSLAHSFSMKPQSDRLSTCSAAAALLLDRAVKD